MAILQDDERTLLGDFGTRLYAGLPDEGSPKATISAAVPLLSAQSLSSPAAVSGDVPAASAADLTPILVESFETDGNGTRYSTSVAEFSDGSGDFFTRTDGSNIGSFYEVTGQDGSFFFGAMDLDGEGDASTQTLTFTGIDITGYTNLTFSGLFAEDDDAANQDWDADSLVFVEAQIDGGGYTKILQFASQGATNTEPGLDADFDGVADSTALTATFANFSAAIAGAGSTLDVRITFAVLDAGDEDISVDNIQVSGLAAVAPTIVINEVDADTAGTDTQEFIELYDGGVGNTSLDGYVLVLFNGSSDTSYAAFDLDGMTTDADGFFVLGNSATPNVDLVFGDNTLQNGADAVALYQGDATDFPNGTAVTATNLVDSIVYDTGDADDAGLLGVLGGTQYDENANANQAGDSNARVPDGSGDFVASSPTPGATNAAPGTSLAIAATDAVKAEGDSGTTDFTFTVTRSGDASGATDVAYAVSSMAADAADFGGVLPSGTVSFLAGETTQTVTISVSGDTDVENNEDFTVTLSNATGGATISTASANGTIQNDDAASVTVLINEFGPNPVGTDPAMVSVELKGEAGSMFSGWFVSIESDGANGTVDSAVMVSGTFDANGLLTVSIPDLENPSFTVVLTDSFTGTVGTTDVDADNDGTADDFSAFGTIYDAIGVPDATADEASVYGADFGGTDFVYTGDEPGLIFRDGVTNDLYAVNDPANGEVYDVNGNVVAPTDFDTDPTLGATFGAINPTTDVPPVILINEFQSNPPGADAATQTFELKGTAGEAFSGWIVSIESDGANGTVDRAEMVSGTFDANGLLTVDIADLENPSFTIVLTDSFTGAVGATDVDADDDGTADDFSAFGTIYDAVGIADATADEASLYGADFGGTDLASINFEPELVFRDGATNDFYQVATIGGMGDQLFDANGGAVDPASFDTDPTLGTSFGSSNPTFTAPPMLTAIGAIQGNAANQGTNGLLTDVSPLLGQTVTVQAVVVGDYQTGNGSDGDLGGFYIQDPFGDGDVTTSDGIFVFTGATPQVNVALGDTVTITGTVEEFFGQTQIDAEGLTFSVDASGFDISTLITTVDFTNIGTRTDDDGDVIADLEAYEGMLIDFAQVVTVISNFNLDRFGEVEVSAAGRLVQYTQDNAPDAMGYADYLNFAASQRFIVDDGFDGENNPISRPDGSFGEADDFRLGDTSSDLTGVLGYGFDEYRLRPVDIDGNGNPYDDVTFDDTNPRPTAAPDVGGTLQVASVNVLNFFTTLDEGSNTTANGFDPRGADNQTEFDRQIDKLVDGILGTGAEVIALQEIENDFDGLLNTGKADAIQVLVDALNAELGGTVWDFVDPGVDHVGDDAIATAFIYDATKVGIASGTSPAILDDSVLSTLPGFEMAPATFNGANTNRAILAVTFEDLASGETFTAVDNHFKSKGGTGTGADADAGDGQEDFNATRLRAALALAAWLETNPTGSDDQDVVILGDLNAYSQEDPVQALVDAGFADLVEAFDPDAYGYTFDGFVGSLDHALASETLAAQVTGAAHWLVNADEADALDYNTDFSRDVTLFNGDTPTRFSDHDPIIIGLNLAPADGVLTGDNNDNVLDGGAGDDLVSGLGGDDVLLGGDGNDTVEGGSGRDTIRGGAGNDLVTGNDGADTVFGGDGDDTVIGGFGADVLSGQAGNDAIYGGVGHDVADGGADDDLIAGADGNDRLSGNVGNDTVFGGMGDDVLVGAAGADSLFGNADNDRIFGGDDGDFINAGLGDDLATGNAGNDTLFGDAGNDTLYGGAGDDDVNGNAGADLIFGNAGNDIIRGGGGNDTVNGGDNEDTVIGGDGDDLINLGAGADQANGGVGNDVILGGNGADQIFGHLGDDTIDGGRGNDLLNGEGGADTFLYDAAFDAGIDVIADFEAGVGAGDVISLTGYGSALDSFSDVLIAALDNGVDTVIDLGNGNSITLLGVLVADLAEDDFLFA